MATGYRPLDFQVSAAVKWMKTLIKCYVTGHCFLARCFRFMVLWLPVVGLDEEFQIELVHVIHNVVTVPANEIMVLLDFLLEK